MSDDTDLAWAAGFIDGEGYIGRSSVAPRITVANTDRRPLDLLQEMFGGSIGIHRRPKKPTEKLAWGWYIHGRPSTERVLEQVRPYLVVKGEAADAILGVPA